jgi:hypothetical protein
VTSLEGSFWELSAMPVAIGTAGVFFGALSFKTCKSRFSLREERVLQHVTMGKPPKSEGTTRLL